MGAARRSARQCAEKVKQADRPDSVQPALLRAPAVTAIPLGRASLHGSVLPTRTLLGPNQCVPMGYCCA